MSARIVALIAFSPAAIAAALVAANSAEPIPRVVDPRRANVPISPQSEPSLSLASRIWKPIAQPS
nr:hypothetical protein [Sphingomonas sp.]